MQALQNLHMVHGLPHLNSLIYIRLKFLDNCCPISVNSSFTLYFLHFSEFHVSHVKLILSKLLRYPNLLTFQYEFGSKSYILCLMIERNPFLFLYCHLMFCLDAFFIVLLLDNPCQINCLDSTVVTTSFIDFS